MTTSKQPPPTDRTSSPQLNNHTYRQLQQQPASSSHQSSAAPSPILRHGSTSTPNRDRDPSSATSASSSRRPSQMLPPPAPLTSPPFAQISSGSPGISRTSSMSGSEIGPSRFPRQLSPAEIHAELEKEQEAAVNRLTRQLSLLRAQQVASPTSHPISDDLANTYPTTSSTTYNPAARSRRTSSNASTALTNMTTAATAGGSTNLSLSRQSSIRSLSGARPNENPAIAPPLSRQSSVRSIGGGTGGGGGGIIQPGGNSNSGRNSPVVGSTHFEPYPYYTSQFYHSHPNYSGSWKDRESQYAGSETGGSEKGLGLSYGSMGGGGSTSGGGGGGGGGGRYEEVLAARTELESVRRENERLKDRIRELERGLEESTKSKQGQVDGIAAAAATTPL